ncbi:MAG TPA: hypothetical protein PLM25_03470 [Limnochordia bacterium]|nr:hypothetical protein [Limnochordia bacterium]
MVGSNFGTLVVEPAGGPGQAGSLAAPIDNPNTAYLAATRKLDFSGLPAGEYDSISSAHHW